MVSEQTNTIILTRITTFTSDLLSLALRPARLGIYVKAIISSCFKMGKTMGLVGQVVKCGGAMNELARSKLVHCAATFHHPKYPHCTTALFYGIPSYVTL